MKRLNLEIDKLLGVSMKKLVLTAVLIQLFCFSAISADFLTGARGAGIGLPFFVLADDPAGALYNPAGLGFIDGWQGQMMYNRANDYSFGGADGSPYNGYFGTTFHKPDLGSFGLNFSQTGAFSSEVPVQKTNYFSVSFGREFADGLSFGSSVKYMKESHYEERSAIDLDFGGLYRAKSGIMLGASIENALKSELSPVAFGIKESLPRRERIGGAYFYEASTYQAVFGTAVQFEQAGFTEEVSTALFGVGTEWWFNQYGKYSFAARAGYNFGESAVGDLKEDYSSPSLGFSLNTKLGFNNLRIDYSWQMHPYETNDGSSPSNHFVAFTYGWGGVPSYNNAQQEVFFQKPVVEVREIAVAPVVPQVVTEESEEVAENFGIDNDTNFENFKFQRYDVEIRSTNISRLDFKRVIFYFNRKQVILTSSWKLFVFKAKIRNWNSDEIDRWVLKTIDGKGIPPINIAWDGITDDGRLLPEGNYYAVLTAMDSDGERFATKWHKFHVD